MLKLKGWLLSLLVLAITAVPVMAGNNDAKTENTNANTTSTEGGPAGAPTPSPSLGSSVAPAGDANVTALLGVLVMKGVLAPTEANAIRNAAPNAQFQALIEALSQKGLVNAQDLAAISSALPTSQPAALTIPVSAALSTQAAAPKAVAETKPAGPSVIPAIAPLRVLPVDPPKKDGLKAAFNLGPVKMTPYGFLKATGVYDSSNPNGDDMPFPGLFLATPQVFSTGPTKDPEFHLKARSARIGANFEWSDLSPKLTVTGRLEGDFEGNFTEVDNRDVSSIRSSQFSIRQAWMRLDYAASENTDVFFEGGQDWTLFGSSALPNLLETTALGYWYGDVYERSPQLQFGLVQKLTPWRNLKVAPTFAMMMPSTGQIEKLGANGLAGQLAQAEREGADSARPEIEGRVAFQFQLDPAPAVAPAQIIFSGVHGRRTSIVPNSSYGTMCATTPNYCAAFPNGFTSSSTIWGGQFAVQLPTRWFTLVASAYKGGDLRFFFGGQVNTYATDTGGLVGIHGPFSTLDGGPLVAAGGAVLGCNTALDPVTGDCPTPGNVVAAPQRPIRAFGGFINLGLPLSRWFNADPKGRNAGWQLFLHAGKDQVVNRDLNNPGFTGNANTLAPLPLLMGKLAAVTLYYKLNPYVSFGFEQSLYATRLANHLTLYSIAGKSSNEWQDHRTEFGPIFTF